MKNVDIEFALAAYLGVESAVQELGLDPYERYPEFAAWAHVVHCLSNVCLATGLSRRELAKTVAERLHLHECRGGSGGRRVLPPS